MGADRQASTPNCDPSFTHERCKHQNPHEACTTLDHGADGIDCICNLEGSNARSHTQARTRSAQSHVAHSVSIYTTVPRLVLTRDRCIVPYVWRPMHIHGICKPQLRTAARCRCSSSMPDCVPLPLASPPRTTSTAIASGMH